MQRYLDFDGNGGNVYGGGGYTAPLPSGGTPLGNVWSDGQNIQLGTSTGSTIGTSPTQKLAFWGGTPVVRPSALTSATGAVTATAGASYTSTEQTMLNDLKTLTTNLRTRLNELESKLQSMNALS